MSVVGLLVSRCDQLLQRSSRKSLLAHNKHFRLSVGQLAPPSILQEQSNVLLVGWQYCIQWVYLWVLLVIDNSSLHAGVPFTATS